MLCCRASFAKTLEIEWQSNTLIPVFYLLGIGEQFEKGFVSMAYGDVGGPNLDFSNMGCMGFCPEMFSFGDYVYFYTKFTAVLYISYWIIKIAIRLIKHSIKTYKLKNENVVKVSGYSKRI